MQLRDDRRPKMPCKVRGLEGNQIRGEKTTQELFPDGETTEDLRRRESYMEEESNWSIGERFANHRWDKHQVIVVHPDWKRREYDENNG